MVFFIIIICLAPAHLRSHAHLMSISLRQLAFQNSSRKIIFSYVFPNLWLVAQLSDYRCTICPQNERQNLKATSKLIFLKKFLR